MKKIIGTFAVFVLAQFLFWTSLSCMLEHPSKKHRLVLENLNKKAVLENLNQEDIQTVVKYSQSINSNSNALQYALDCNLIALFKQLVDAGFDVQAPSYWPTLLFHTQNYEATKILLEAGIDHTIKDSWKRTAFICRWRELEEQEDDCQWIFLLLKAMKCDKKTVLNFIKNPDTYYREKLALQKKLLQKMSLYIADFH